MTTEELEHCWRVRPEGDARTVELLAGLELLAGARLEAPTRHRLEDRVLDDASGSLRAVGATLRLRVADGRPLLTVKGPTQTDGSGAMRRFEWEHVWGVGVLDQALERLASLGAHPRATSAGPRDAEPLAALGASGLEVIHGRCTERVLRRLRTPAGDPLGELAIDRVEYRVAGLAAALLHREVELEIAPGADPGAFGAATRALEAVGGEDLIRWPHSKTALGAALERLAIGPRGAELLGHGGQLRDAAYRVLADEIGAR